MPKSQRKNPKDRLAVLTGNRQQKMARSAHAYVRGNTQRFYEWLDSKPGNALPQGPPVWICGDCHIGNLGPIADAEGRIEIQIRDLDQTVIGNPVHDLVRLALSLAAAARGSNLPGITTAYMLEDMIKGYEAGLTKHFAKGKAAPEPIEQLLQEAVKRRWRHLARERIKDVTPSIPLGRRFWALTSAEAQEIDRLFKTAELETLITSLKCRDDGDKIDVLDAAYWIKGCSSLGRLRYAVLVGTGKKVKHQRYCLIDIKEATSAAAPRHAKSSMPKDNAKRVVEGARHLSPYLGERMVATHFLNKPVVMRELLPQDLKVELDQLSRKDAVAAAYYLAGVVGQAHARQMDTPTKKQWLAVLSGQRSKSLDAPSWLWTSVVELIANHEVAYLEHCRKHSLRAKAS